MALRVGIVAVAAAAGGMALAIAGSEPSEYDQAQELLESGDLVAQVESGHGGRIVLPEREADAASASAPVASGTLTLQDLTATRVYSWDDLVPAKGEGLPVSFSLPIEDREGTPKGEGFDDLPFEERIAFAQDIDMMRAMQPEGARIRGDLDGQTVRIAGYVTPIGFDDQAVTDFLLVPYLGACIHVPPPPANQIVYVSDATGLHVDDMWEPVWITGTLRASPVATVLADVGYLIEGARVEAYR